MILPYSWNFPCTDASNLIISQSKIFSSPKPMVEGTPKTAVVRVIWNLTFYQMIYITFKHSPLTHAHF